MRNLTKTVLFTLALTLGGLALAGGPPGHGPRGPLQVFMQEIKDLDLSEEQREAIREIVKEAREDRKKAHQERSDAMLAFRNELLSAKPDAKRLHAMADQRQEERSEHMHDRIDDLIAVTALLTPPQKTALGRALDERRAEMKARHEERRGRQDR